MVAAELGGPDRRYFVVQAGGRVEGYAGLFLGWDVAEVMTIAVAPDWRGRGLGRALMEGILAEAALAGRRRVILEVAEGSEAAVGLYRWLGFEPIGRRRAYYQPSGRDALVMRLDLPG
jgi:ribosomal-protein-alanine N-acetyltransferase